MRAHDAGQTGSGKTSSAKTGSGRTPDAARDRAPATRVTPATPSRYPAAAGEMDPASALALQRAAGNAVVSRMLADREPVQRSAVRDVLRGGGRPFAGPLKEEMEERLGADFSGVRIHTDEAARASAAEIGARAYTSGDHVVLGDGGTDKHTLAHELTHVIQQREGPVAGADSGSGLRISDPSDHFERAAEANARRVMSVVPPGMSAAAARTAADQSEHAGETARGSGKGKAVQRVPVAEGTIGAAIHQELTGSREAIAQLAAKVGTDEWHLVNAMLDPAYDPMGAHAADPQILEANLKDRLSYASCYPTAEALFPVLTGTPAARAAHGRNPDKCRSLEEFQGEVNSLLNAMSEAFSEGAPAVFRIEFAGHGFTLVMRRGDHAPSGPLHFELIESLAHATGIVESLFSDKHIFNPAQIDEAIRRMASADVSERIAGARILGWNAQAIYLGDPQPTEAEHFPETRLKWWKSPLHAAAGAKWHEIFRQRFNFIAQHYGTPGIR